MSDTHTIKDYEYQEGIKEKSHHMSKSITITQTNRVNFKSWHYRKVVNRISMSIIIRNQNFGNFFTSNIITDHSHSSSILNSNTNEKGITLERF
jgi:hypothetical protein